MKRIFQISIAFLCGMVAIHAQNLEKRIAPVASSDLSNVTTLERLSGAGFAAGDRVYDTNLEASYQYTGNGKWLLLSGAGVGSTGIASSSFGLPTLNATATSYVAATPGALGLIYTGGDILGSSDGSVTIANLAVNTAKLAGDAVNSDKILNFTILNEDISPTANINGTKIANNTITPSKINFSSFGDGIFGSVNGNVGALAGVNKIYNGLSRAADGTSDSVFVGTSDVVLNIFNQASLASDVALLDMGLEKTTSGIYYNASGGFDIVISVKANVNFRRNANDTGERTLKLELLDCDTGENGLNAGADAGTCTVVETHNIRSVRGVVVADLPTSIDGTFKLFGEGDGTSTPTAFRIVAKSGIDTNNTNPVKIGGYQSADNISIVRLQ